MIKFYLPDWASKFEHFDILLARHGILLAPGKRASASVEPCIVITIVPLKPQDSFGELGIFFLDLQKVQEIIRKHHQTFCKIAFNDKLQCNIAQWQIIIMYITYGKVFGGTPNIFMFWLFLENGSISERTVNRALIVNTSL